MVDCLLDQNSPGRRCQGSYVWVEEPVLAGQLWGENRHERDEGRRGVVRQERRYEGGCAIFVYPMHS